jgi:hypothetical protein
MEDNFYIIKTERKIGEEIMLSLLDNRPIRRVSEDELSELEPEEYELIPDLDTVKKQNNICQ